jgi:gliding motility-associated lipoprotein GldD
MRWINSIPAALLIGLITTGCRPTPPVPKPRAYFKIDLPEHKYQQFDSANFPFSFEFPVYGKISQDRDLIKEQHSPYWINVDVASLDATIYLSYKSIGSEESLDRLVEESYKLSYAHDIRADYIKTPQFRTKNGLTGIYYYVGGNAASSCQFFITDEKKNFIRGALYFNATPNADSLKPASDFMKKDMEHLVQTLRFK